MGTGPSPVVVALGSQSPFGVEAAEGVVGVALGVGQVQVAVPADDHTDHPTLQQGPADLAQCQHAMGMASLQAQPLQGMASPESFPTEWAGHWGATLELE